MSGFRTAPDWTPEEDAAIIEARKSGTPTRYIARKLQGRTESAIDSRIRRLRSAGRIVMGVAGGGRPQTITADVDPTNPDDFDSDEKAFRRDVARGSARLLAAIMEKGFHHV